MKRIILLLLIIALKINAQIDFSGGMGINFSSATSLNDYINALNPTNRLSTFNSNIEFYGEIGYNYSAKMIIGLDYSYSINSYTNDYYGIGKYEIKYNQHSPTLMAYYVMKGEGYKFKFGGGLGLRYLLLNQTLPQSNVPSDYSTTGFGILLKAEGNTAIGKNVFATIAFTLKLDYPGIPKNNGESLSLSTGDMNNVNVNSISGGIRLGILYSF
jgi:hypothetical protein